MDRDNCVDCGKRDGVWMASEDLWAIYGAGKDILCLACFAKRLPRELRRCDLNPFTSCNKPLFDLLDLMEPPR